MPTATRWTQIRALAAGGEAERREAMELLFERYWPAVYAHLRSRGCGREAAAEITQAFFAEVVLGRGLIEKADKSKGRFRSFLLIALNRYLINIEYEESAQKRIPKDKLVSLDIVDLPELPHTVERSNPEESFNYAWISSLLEQVMAEVEAACQKEGKAAHWAAFKERILQPATGGTGPPAMSKICRKYGITSPITASNMIVTVKRRLAKTFAEHIRSLVTSDEEAADELNEIRRFLPKIAQYAI